MNDSHQISQTMSALNITGSLTVPDKPAMQGSPTPEKKSAKGWSYIHNTSNDARARSLRSPTGCLQETHTPIHTWWKVIDENIEESALWEIWS